MVVDEWGMLSKDKEEPIDNLISWVFDEGTFKPAAKIVDGEQFSIITDYLGTPVEMYDSQGTRTWAVEYDIYGKVRKQVEGDAGDCPFRYQGQYEDVETGLYYNRFRYYSAEEGVYISQDPIGLSGGMPNFYSYTHDSNSLIDVFGLSFAGWNEFQKGMKGTFNNGNQMPWNSPPSNSADSAEGWKWYKSTNQGNDAMVIGRLEDTGKFKGKNGFNVLDSNRWSPGVNKSWVQGGIDRGASFKLVSAQTTNNLWDAKRGAPTVFADELNQLKKAGYVKKGGFMVPGKGCK